MFEILTPGQKLKKLRKYLNLTQAQLASGSISREFISMVEHGQREMSPDSATLLFTQMRKVAEIKDVPFLYDEFYLNRNIKEEIIYQTRHLDVELVPAQLLDIKNKIAEYEILSAELYLDYEIGKRFLENGNLNNALEYSKKAYDAALKQKDTEVLIKLSNNLGHIKSSLNHTEEAISYFNTAFDLTDDTMLKSALLYNIISTLYHSGNYNAVEEEFRRIKLLDMKIAEKYDQFLLDIKGLMLLQSNQLNESRKIFEQLLTLETSPSFKALVLSNLSEVELQAKNYALAEKLNNESAALRQNQPNLLQENLLNSAHILWDSGKADPALLILENYIKQNDGPRVGNAYRLLLEIYRSQNNIENFSASFKKGLEFFSNSNQIEKFVRCMALGSQYLGNNRPEEYYSIIKPFLNRFID
ncbi:MAG: helix-turn-helix transcriptional regulator [Clostridiaceae bacterium]